MLRHMRHIMQYNQRKNDYTTKKRVNENVNTLEIHDTGVDHGGGVFATSILAP